MSPQLWEGYWPALLGRVDADNLPSAVHISPVEPGHDITTIELWTFHICSIWSQISSDFWMCLLVTEVLIFVDYCWSLLMCFFYPVPGV